MPKNIPNPNELELLAEGSHTFHPSTYKANTIQILNTTFTFESVITKLNQPVGKGVTVYLYHKGLGTLIAKTETDEDSKIYIPNLSKHNEYMVVAIDPKDIYNSVIFDITFDLSANLSKNPTLKYYSIYDVPNLQKLYAYWDTLSDQRTDPNLLFFISNPNFKDDLDLIWGMNGTVKTITIKDIRTFTFTNSGEYIYLYHNPVPPKEQFTFSAYIYVDSNNRNTTTDNNVFKQHTQSFCVDSNLKLVYKNTDNSNNINLTSTSNIVVDEWNHVSISFDGTRLYLFLNGILQTSVANSLGMSYTNSTFTIGEGFKGYITQPLMTSDCKYTEDFEFLLKAFSYKSQIYSDPTDTIAEYVRIKVTSNKLGYGLRDEVNNISFNSGVKNTNFTSVNTKTRMVAYTKNNLAVLAARDFCIEMKIKVKNVTDNYPKLVSNHNEYWTSNAWEFDINHLSYPNTYSLHVANVGSWAFNYPTIFNELIDLAVVREGTNLRFYVNGFLDRTINVGTTSFDNAANCFIALMYYVNCNFYDFKYTVGHHRYSSNYVPAPLNWPDADIVLDQYKTINLPFKQTLSDTQYVFQFSVSGVALSKTVSINNTKSAYFKNAKIVTNNKLFVNNEKFTFELFYQPKTEALSGTTSIISIQNAFRLGTNAGVLSFFNGTSWEDTTYNLDDTKLNHLVLQRDGTTIKVLADGNLVLTTTYTFPAGLKTITIGCFNDTEYIDGYINNFIMYKCITKYTDTYTVPLEELVVTPPEKAEPEVIVNEYTTSGLDFENGLIDKVSTTVWQKEGTADVTSVNKILGDNSFETKALGDSLYTNSNIITGGSTPFTIEFYALIKNGGGYQNKSFPLFSKNNNSGGGDQVVGVDKDAGGKIYLYRDATGGGVLGDGTTIAYGKTNLNYNDINKYTITYDGASIRLFVNDKLEAIAGTLNGFKFSNSEPFRFFRTLVPSYASYSRSTYGLIDNINIHDGVATKVRDPDPYEEFLVVDLAFDGENNSTRIVDNARLNERNEVKYNDNIVSLIKPINNGITDDLGNNWVLNGTTFGPGVFDYQAITNGSISWTDPGRNLSSWAIFYETIGSLDFYIKRGNSPSSNVIFNYWYDDIRWRISLSDIQLTFNVYIGGSQTIFFNLPTKTNNFELFSLVRHSDNKWELFVDGVSCGKSGIYTGITYAGIGNNLAISTVNGTHQISLVRFIKGSDTYKSNFVLPTEPFKYVPKTNWTVNGNAKISTDQKFDGFSSLNTTTSNTSYIESSNFSVLPTDKFTVEFQYIVSAEAGSPNVVQFYYDGWYYLMLSVSITGNIQVNVNGTIYITKTVPNLSNDIKYRMVYDNKVVKLYINNILIQEAITDGVNLPVGTKLSIGKSSSSNPIYVKNFKIYKGVAVIPKDPTGKIQLDFDNNVVDKYGNSTWTNNGVTFDAINSIGGSSAKFGPSTVLTSKTDNMDFGTGDFKITYDIKPSESGIGGRYSLTPDLVYTDTKAIWFFGDSVGFDYKDKPTNVVGSTATASPNQYYNLNVVRKNKNLHTYVNDIIISTHNLAAQTFDFSKFNSGACLGKSPNFGVGQSFNGYIDNFKSVKNYQSSEKVELPAVYFPFRVNATNIGYANNLTVTATGNPTYATVDGVKCIKFESGKYITANTHNIFNLSNNCDFYLEFDFYISGYTSHWQRLFEFGSGVDITFRPNTSPAGLYWCGNLLIPLAAFTYQKWCKIIVKRKDSAITVIVDQDEYPQSNVAINNTSTIYFGTGSYNTSSDNLNGYMSELLMFVGTSEKPSTFNNKTVLDLDFKPTGKSYLFKDNNNKTILSPVNITQRNYLNSDYCCTFNGTNQCIMTFRNPLFNFGTEDFVMKFKFKPVSTTNWNILISNGNTTSGDSAYCYIGISPNNGGNPNQMYATINSSAMQITHPQQIDTNNINIVIFYKEGNTYTLVVNGQAVSNTVTNIPNFDLNNNNNTIIGRTNHNNGSNNHWFTGEMYSVKIFRNTSDLTLLD